MTSDKNFNFEVPILFLIFNRPDTTLKVFNQIRKVKPKKLFIAADGPREKVDDVENCRLARNIVNQIDWDCEVKTLFRKENLGCGKAVSSAINWFFEHVEEGIILEDDCLADFSFFNFCRLMLDKYRYEQKVMMICGTNYFFNKVKSKDSYFFSKYYSVWGWATWKRAWSLFDLKMLQWKKLKNTDFFKKISRDKHVRSFWEEHFDMIINNKIDTWDFPWSFTCFLNDGLAVVPFNNLVSNIGLEGAHANGSIGSSHFMPTKKIELSDIKHPMKIKSNLKMIKFTYKNLKKMKVIGRFSMKEFLKKPLRKPYHFIKSKIKELI